MDKITSQTIPKLKAPPKPARLQMSKNTQSPRFFRFKGQDDKIYGLTAQQKKFAELYLEYQGRGTDALIDAGYDVKNKRGEINRLLAKTMASQNLSKVNIYAYITILLTQEGFNSQNVDKQHLFLINQHSDLSAKSKAIDMYNKLKARYPKDQAEIDLIKKYTNASDEELNAIIEGEVITDDE